MSFDKQPDDLHGECAAEIHRLQDELDQWRSSLIGLKLNELQAELADCSRSHPHENMTKTCELRTEIARLANQNALLQSCEERVFSILSIYGVPKERARDVANGIEVLVTRMDREIAALMLFQARVLAEGKQSALHLAAKLVTINTAANKLRDAYIDQFSSGPFECSTTPELEAFDAAIAQCSPQPNEVEPESFGGSHCAPQRIEP